VPTYDPLILAVDPGSERSGWVLYRGGSVLVAGVSPNLKVRDMVAAGGSEQIGTWCSHFAVEVMRPRGEPFSSQAMDTLIWVGRLMEAWEVAAGLDYFVPVVREDSKRFVCGKGGMKDGNVRQGLIERLGGPGTKKNPGPTFGVTSHAWQALAVAVTAEDVLARRGGRRRARL
jgi:hypothetical protein